MAFGKPTFTLKTYGAQLYKWSPETGAKKNTNMSNAGKTAKPFFCDARPNSQGQDWTTSYVYTIKVTPSGVQERSAYVECDYVE